MHANVLQITLRPMERPGHYGVSTMTFDAVTGALIGHESGTDVTEVTMREEVRQTVEFFCAFTDEFHESRLWGADADSATSDAPL